MKKILVTLMVLCCTCVAWAQNDVMTAILQHGDEATSFVGRNALVEAHEAAVDGDQITLSEGSFISPTITKSISIYGAGFEKDETTGTAVTMLTGVLQVGKEGGETLSNVRLEGLYVNARIDAAMSGRPVEGIVITKCYVNGDVRFRATATNVEISKNVITGSVHGDGGNTAISLQVLNSWIGGNVSGFSVSSSVQADHSNICGDYGGAILYTNCVLSNGFITSSAIAEGSTVRYCLTNGKIPSSNRLIENCYVVSTANMFADAGDHNYTPERTFELNQPDVWVGNDGTQVGLHGGSGWNKVPGTPVVKNLQLNVEGKTLKVNYEAEVR